MIQVFLSYASEDRERVETLYQNLVAAGFQAWMDTHDLSPGEEWEKGIQRGIQSADCFLACISTHSKKDGVLADELRAAVERWRQKLGDYRLIPVRLEPVELPASIAHLQWCNVFSDEQWTTLAKAIRKRTWPPRWMHVAAIAVGADLIGLHTESRTPQWMHVAAIAVGIVGLAFAIWYLMHDNVPRWPPGPVRVGVTLWRLREPRPEDRPGAKMLVHPQPGASGTREYVPERSPLEKPFALGDLIRASFECAQQGFLYVIDQEQHLGGAAGPPKLIFPTMKLRGGRNQVAAGQLVETPAHEDIPPYWELRDLSADHTGELLTVIFARQPIAELSPGEEARDVEPSWLEARLTEWKTTVTKTETGSGTAATAAEIEAGKGGGKALTHADPLPQTIFSGTPNPTVPLVARFLIDIVR